MLLGTRSSTASEGLEGAFGIDLSYSALCAASAHTLATVSVTTMKPSSSNTGTVLQPSSLQEGEAIHHQIDADIRYPANKKSLKILAFPG